jgi:hypothetical protein
MSTEVQSYSGTNSTVHSNDKTHERIAEDTGTDSHSPAQASSDHRRSCTQSQSRDYNHALSNCSHTHFPIGDGPSIGHPVSNIGTRAPRAFRRRDGVEVGIGCSWSRSKTAGLLVDRKRKATALDGSGMARLYRLSGERVLIGP